MHTFVLFQLQRRFGMRKGAELLALLVASSLCLSAAIAAQETCPADIDAKCGDAASDGWEGEFFPGITKIRYEGPTSKKPLSYKWYNAEEVILGKKMKDWLRFSVAFWHTFRGTGGDPFGAATKNWPWEDGTNSLAMAKRRSTRIT
uniref:xylose isomerase n=2 Tax=Aegilops tauschii subsp. strangulata TaxID=200361 RepID=A0A453AR34_AEGTS